MALTRTMTTDHKTLWAGTGGRRYGSFSSLSLIKEQNLNSKGVRFCFYISNENTNKIRIGLFPFLTFCVSFV